MVLGFLLQGMMVQFYKKINTGSPNFAVSLIFLLIARPMFVGGFALMILPVILGNQSTKPIARFLGHEYWASQSRLVFGVFLCNSIWMQYHIYNVEHGLWLQKFDGFLLFCSFLTFSFIFSLFTYLMIDGPTSLLVSRFIKLDHDIGGDYSMASGGEDNCGI